MKDSRQKKNATVSDVAKRAGLSVGTVSRYLNGAKLREANRARIANAIRELSYSTNFIARSMKTARTQSVGVLITRYDQLQTAVVAGLTKRLREAGYTVIVYYHGDDVEMFQESFEFITSRHVDGVIVSGIPVDGTILDDYMSTGRPVVVFNNDIEGVHVDRVLVEDEEASRQAVHHLLERNHTRIGIISGDLNHSTGINRLSGYKRALKESDLTCDDALIVAGQWTTEGGYTAAKRLFGLSSPPTALFVSNYLMAIGALTAANELRIDIPKDLSIVSFDDIDVYRAFRPPITAVAQPIDLIAERLAATLLSRIDNRDAVEPVRTTLPCTFIVRESTREL